MAQTLKIDFVSDIACPWCAIGLAALDEAVRRCGDTVAVQMHFQPFELNPAMGPEGEDVGEHLTKKYGSTPEQQTRIRETIRARGAEVGFAFNPQGRGRIWNTFDAHRLLHWAALEGAPGDAYRLKRALLQAYHGEARNPGDPAVLLDVVSQLGLDVARARQVIEGGEFADAVRERERFYTSNGIHSVPSIIINDRHLIQGGQPVEVFEQVLRELGGVSAVA